MMLRLQKERMTSALLPSESEYFKMLRAHRRETENCQARCNSHASRPINRGVEIDSKVADGPQSVILNKSATALQCVWRLWRWRCKRHHPASWKICRVLTIHDDKRCVVMTRICITQGRIIDPANDIDRVGSVYIEGGKIISIIDEPAGF